MAQYQVEKYLCIKLKSGNLTNGGRNFIENFDNLLKENREIYTECPHGSKCGKNRIGVCTFAHLTREGQHSVELQFGHNDSDNKFNNPPPLQYKQHISQNDYTQLIRNSNPISPPIQTNQTIQIPNFPSNQQFIVLTTEQFQTLLNTRSGKISGQRRTRSEGTQNNHQHFNRNYQHSNRNVNRIPNNSAICRTPINLNMKTTTSQNEYDSNQYTTNDSFGDNSDDDFEYDGKIDQTNNVSQDDPYHRL